MSHFLGDAQNDKITASPPRYGSNFLWTTTAYLSKSSRINYVVHAA